MRQFNTLTGFLLSKSSNPSINDIVEFSGYDSAGDGGGAKWKHNGVTGQTPSQSPAQLGGFLLNDGDGNQWGLIVDGAVNAQSLGLTGVGVETAVLKAIASGAQNNHEVFFPVDFAIDESIDFTTSPTLDFKNSLCDATAIPVGTQGNQRYAVSMQGSKGSSGAITNDIEEGDKVIAGAPDLSYSEGDVVFVESTQIYLDGSSGSCKRGEILTVKSFLAGSLTLQGSTYFSYLASATLKITKLNVLNKPKVLNFRLLCAGSGAIMTGLKLDMCQDPEVTGAFIDGCEDVAIRVNKSIGGSITKNRLINCTSPHLGTSGSTYNSGYGVLAADGTRDMEIRKNNLVNNRRSVTGGGEYPSLFVKTLYNTVMAGFNGLGTHEPCFEWEIVGNVIEGMYGFGINIRGINTVARNNFILDVGSNGINVRSFNASSVGVYGTRLLHNRIRNTNGAAIKLEGTATDGPVNDTIIEGGDIDGYLFDGIIATYVNGLKVTGIDITNQKAGAAGLSGQALTVNGSSALRCSEVVVDKITSGNVLRSGMLFNYCDNVKVSKYIMRAAPIRYGVEFVESTKASVEDSTILANIVGTAFLHGIGFDNCDDIKVKSNTITGDGGTVNVHGVRVTNSSGSSLNHTITDNLMKGLDKAVSVVSSGTNNTIVTGNNGVSCINATKFDISSVTKVVANNLV